VERLLFVVVLAIILIAIPLLVLGDTASSTADPDMPKSEVISSIGKASNSSASAAITITMYTGNDSPSQRVWTR